MSYYSVTCLCYRVDSVYYCRVATFSWVWGVSNCLLHALPGAHSFDDLQLKLIFFEQRINFIKVRDVPSHQAIAATIATSDSGGVANKQAITNTKGKNNGGCHFNKEGKCRYNKNNNRAINHQNQSQSGSFRSMPVGYVFYNSVVSLPSTYCTTASCTILPSVGSNQTEGILRSHPNLIC